MPKVKALGAQQRAKQSAINNLKASIAYYSELHGLSNYELAALAGISYSAFCARMRDPTLFRFNELLALSDTFKVPASKLLEPIS